MIKGGRVVLLVFGSLFVIVALVLLAGSGVLFWAESTFKDAEDFYTSGPIEIDRDAVAITTQPADIHLGVAWMLDWSRLVNMRLTVTNDEPGKGVFIGIADAEDTAGYLAGVSRDEITDIKFSRRRGKRLEYRRFAGAILPADPLSQDFWVTSVHGPGTQTLTWTIEEGSFVLVLMNEDSSVGINAEVRLGAKLPLVRGIAIGLLVGGIVFLLVAVFMIVMAVRKRSYPQVPQQDGSLSVDYPATLSIRYTKRNLDRLTTFFRPIVAIPILIVVSLLGGAGFVWWGGPWKFESPWFAAFVVLPTVLLIVFQRKYPRWWFDWNLALAKFVTRVAAYLALLTDIYPSTDDEQAVDLRISYPNVKMELSQWMPLVKWFLAIPHYIALWFLDVATVVVVIIAWFAILFAGRYPKNLFDFVVGVFRWHLRVAAYMVLLTTDEYPPFTLD